MRNERRRVERYACRIPAASEAGTAVIEDVSAHGARVRSAQAVRHGERFPLYLCDAKGRGLRLHAVVRRVRRTSKGNEIGCSFEADAASSVAAWRLAQSAACGPIDGFVPIAPRLRSSPRSSLSDHFGLRTLLLLGAGVALLGLGSIIALAYAAMG